MDAQKRTLDRNQNAFKRQRRAERRQSGDDVILAFLPLRKIETGYHSRSIIIQRRMRTNKVVEENKHGNKIIGRGKRVESLFGFVPSLKLFIESLNQIVGNIIFERSHSDMSRTDDSFDRLLIGGITVRNYSVWFAKVFDRVKQRESLRRVSVR